MAQALGMIKTIEVGSRVLAVERENDTIVVRFRRYPDYPSGNYVDEVIRIYGDKTAEMYRVRNNWNGSGRDDYGRIVLTESEYRELIEAINNVKRVEDFENIVNIFNNILSERVKKVDTMVEKLSRALSRYKYAVSVFKSLCERVCRTLEQ